MGASIPKVTTDPDCVVEVSGETVLDPLFDPHATISAAARTTTPPAKNTIFRLCILPSSSDDVVSVATLSM
jgi:hypothetical protein